ncbi:CLUMA_CG012983, isoform A [Clunio marinus]|uniref:CLUMA_CG012983, isoform A n=1 Tax=Clunio marinus TaxID=568069 RepID=A0A1J1IHP3_9DIPT|nr:CLUMA_CG012983, isoform A [Clunio marinus]
MADISFRKRSRENEDLSEEFFPLSKRINNLHLSPEFPPISSTEFMSDISQFPKLQNEIQNHQYNYNPELKLHDNPNYYDANKILYQLYMERSQRTK